MTVGIRRRIIGVARNIFLFKEEGKFGAVNVKEILSVR